MSTLTTSESGGYGSVAPVRSEESDQAVNGVEKLNMNVMTVGALLAIAIGGAVSFGILFEQNRRHEATLAKVVDVVDDLRLLAATHSHAIETLQEEIAELKRNRT